MSMSNQLITLAECVAEMASVLRKELLALEALAMFIEGQYNWERPEFDEHG
jgi:hypothetical protein